MDQTELRNSLIALHSASFAWALVCCRRNRELAEDVLQSVYLRVLDGNGSYQGRSAFRTWLFSVIRNAARDHQRSRWWSRVLSMDFGTLAELVDWRSQPDSNDEAAIVRNAIDRLPHRQQQVTHLVFYEDLTVAAAAEIMGVSLGTARQHYARAKESLRVLLAPLRTCSDESPIR